MASLPKTRSHSPLKSPRRHYYDMPRHDTTHDHHATHKLPRPWSSVGKKKPTVGRRPLTAPAHISRTYRNREEDYTLHSRDQVHSDLLAKQQFAPAPDQTLEHIPKQGNNESSKPLERLEQQEPEQPLAITGSTSLAHWAEAPSPVYEVPRRIVKKREGGMYDINCSKTAEKPVPLPPQKIQSFQDLLEEERDDAEFDTDLEDDFPEITIEDDKTGKDIYIKECKAEGVVPISYVLRHLKDHKLKMSHHYLGEKDSRALSKGIKKNFHIKMLDLSDNHLGEKGTAPIAAMLRENTYIIKLDLSNNFLNVGGCAPIASMLDVNYSLKVLSLKNNQLGDSDASILAKSLKNNSSLTELDLSCNNISEFGAVHLGSGLIENEGLLQFDLSWNSVRGKGGIAIANALKMNTTLESLDLSWNGISLTACQAFGRILKINHSLKILNLSNNRIDKEAAKKLCIGLKKNVSLEALLLTKNPLGDEGISLILKALSKNTSVRVLGLQEMTLSALVNRNIDELQQFCDITVLTSGLGGYHRHKLLSTSNVLILVDQWIKENQMKILDKCFSVDMERTGLATRDQLQKILMDNGLTIDQKQLSNAFKEVNLHYGRERVPYRKLLLGLSALKKL